MLPTAFVCLDALPMTPSGKVDRLQLPAPDHARPRLEHSYVAPRTPIETEVARIWADVLELEQVGVHDPFLALGSDSIRATQVIVRVLDAIHVTVPQRRPLEAPTVAHMAAFIVEHMATQVSEDAVLDLLDELDR
jgi:acyl carrier protein